MARRRKSGLDLIADMPWPFGVALGIAAYFAIRYGIGWYLSTHGGPLLQGLGRQAWAGAYSPFAWMLLAMCWIAALVSYVKSVKRRDLLDMQTGLDSLQAMNWREFETLVGEAFRRQNYVVEETGLGGPDGGVDLILRQGGRKTLVQCKQRKSRQVNVSTIREMWGLAAHHQADAVKVVCVHDFTKDAADFAVGKSIELVTGRHLLELVRDVQQKPGLGAGESQLKTQSTRDAVPECPLCNTGMVLRTNRTNGQHFWGCHNYPRCNGTRPA